MAKFTIPAKVYVGRDSLSEAAQIFPTLGRRALIVTGPHVAKSPMMENLIKELEKHTIAYNVFPNITGEPTDKMIMEGRDCYIRTHCDFLIGIGGGSPLDSAKAIAVMLKCGGKLSDYMGVEIDADLPPIVAIPTTSGTGSEATKFTVITDSEKDIKMLLKGDCLVPDIAILNYEYTIDMPKSVTAATGLDALTHAIEAFTSKKAFCLTDTYAVSAIKRIMNYLPSAYSNGHDCMAREQMMLAAYEAGVCINNSSVTIVHGMSRPIGALFHVPHGISNAMLLKDCLGYALDGAYDRFAILGRETGAACTGDSDEVASEKFLDAVAAVIKACEVPTLRGYGINSDDFTANIAKMAHDAVASGSPGNTRKSVTEQDCIELYEQVILK
ncbi:MAG: iron-containing alcohol dehydrogenase [Lachnospiraceae bacterium]|nr:iron-containing alcohol dehydrogenase [Lachnospiraceae bacterium]